MIVTFTTGPPVRTRTSLGYLLLLLLSITTRPVSGDTNDADTATTWAPPGSVNDVEKARVFLDKYDEASKNMTRDVRLASWDAKTNITDYNNRRLNEISLKADEFDLHNSKVAKQFKRSAMPRDISNLLFLMSDLGLSAQTNVTKRQRLREISTRMSNIYSTAKVCNVKPGQCLVLNPDIQDLLKKSRNYTELAEIWKAWRDASGAKMRELYIEYIDLSNEAYRMAGYKDGADYYKNYYDPLDNTENDVIEEVTDTLWTQLRPLYVQLHAYVRRKLRHVYGEDNFPSTGHIPAHLLGDMWGQTWENIGHEVMPYPEKTVFDVTNNMIKQNYTVKKMFETAEEFFKSLGMPEMTSKFWNLSMFERPQDRDVQCHASALDMFEEDDFRIKMCASVNQADLMTIHHEMGHIEYYMMYKDQLTLYRLGANPGFHEAVGDLMALSVLTPKHLHCIGLLEEDATEDEESELNFLMGMALDRIAFLPFGYLMDKWRWEVYAGDTTPDNYNGRWWELRCDNQGMSPPVPRNESDFDPGAKHHIASGTPYIRYFVSFIIQFQFHKAACDAAGHTGPLHKCDIYNSKAAGDKIKAMLEPGSSRPWREVLKNMTGSDKMDAGPLLEYFRPLKEFLERENGHDLVGWEEGCPVLEEGKEPKVAMSTTPPQKTTEKPSGDAGAVIPPSAVFLLVTALGHILLMNRNE